MDRLSLWIRCMSEHFLSTKDAGCNKDFVCDSDGGISVSVMQTGDGVWRVGVRECVTKRDEE